MVYGLTEVAVKLKQSSYRQTDDSNQEKTETPNADPSVQTVTDQEDTEDDKCLTSTTSLHDTDTEEKASDTHELATEKVNENDEKDNITEDAKQATEKAEESDARNNTVADVDVDADEEEEEEEYEEEEDDEVALASLPETERQLLTIGHAWDDVARGGRIHLHPNAPDICIPARTFGDKVQGLRSRRRLKKGRHCWLLQEIRVYEPGSHDEEKPNNLIVGIGKKDF